MKLPGGDRAIVDIAKLRDYCLDPYHFRGKHKARVFAAVLGFTRADADFLRSELLAAAAIEEAIQTDKDVYGTRYVMNSHVTYLGQTARLRSLWIIRTGESEPRLVTCFIP